jgi:hypothetical protein
MKQYTVSDGKIVLTLQEAEKRRYVVTFPLTPNSLPGRKRSRRPWRIREMLWLLSLHLGES